MIAIDAVYHRACLTRLYRKEAVWYDITESNETQVIRAYVLNELLDFIECYHGSRESLTMAYMTVLYDKHTLIWAIHTSNATPHAFERIPNA